LTNKVIVRLTYCHCFERSCASKKVVNVICGRLAVSDVLYANTPMILAHNFAPGDNRDIKTL